MDRRNVLRPSGSSALIAAAVAVVLVTLLLLAWRGGGGVPAFLSGGPFPGGGATPAAVDADLAAWVGVWMASAAEAARWPAEDARLVSWAAADADPARVCPHIRAVDPACPRFVTFPVAKTGGLGHRLLEVQVGWRAAQRLRATWAIEGAAVFGTPRFGESYVWAYHLFGLAHAEVVTLDSLDARYPNLTRVPTCPYIKGASGDVGAMCNVLIEIPHYMCCDEGDCFLDRNHTGLFDDSKACMRWKRSHGRPLPPDAVNVVWHLRVGDAVLHKDDRPFFAAVARTLTEALAGLPTRHVFTYDGGDADVFPPGFEFLPELLPGARALPSRCSETTYRLLEAADVVVSTGSSFAELPAIAGINAHRMVLLHHVPKHRMDLRNASAAVEHLSDAVDLYSDGSISISPGELRERVLALFCNVNGTVTPLVAEIAVACQRRQPALR